VLSVIARVVPAAAHVERIGALLLDPTGNARVAEVPSGTRVGAFLHVGSNDRYAAAIVVEVLERVVRERLVDAFSNGEREALRSVDVKHQVRAFFGEVAEVNPVNMVAGSYVEPPGDGLASPQHGLGRAEF